MKIVAVSQRVDVLADRNEMRDALDQRLVELLLEVGCMVMPVPNAYGKSATGAGGHLSSGFKAWLDKFQPAMVVLSGGNDIGQCAERDVTENDLLHYAEDNQLPLLGICRGMQMMAHRAGSKLHPVDGHVGVRHDVYGEIHAEVNSFHHLAVTEAPKGYEVLAQCQDGVIEAIRHTNLPWEGWMWHPERETMFFERDIQRIRKLLNA